MKRWIRYMAVATGLVLIALGAGWLTLDHPGRNGVLAAGIAALMLQGAAFALLVAQKPGTPAFLAAWGASTLVRGAVVVGFALWVASLERVDTLVGLLTLVALLFVLLLLEPMALRWGGSDATETNGMARE
ncbi:MAG: hypothetical protein EA422_10675 [Gemmatimonadales bacterium]|nr:MAG: hypothetical protein EA422_10675 [Gemmatimonadales bacterium]